MIQGYLQCANNMNISESNQYVSSQVMATWESDIIKATDDLFFSLTYRVLYFTIVLIPLSRNSCKIVLSVFHKSSEQIILLSKY